MQGMEASATAAMTMTQVVAESMVAAPSAAAPDRRFQPPEIVCGSDLECLDSFLVARTPRDLAWLNAHGYPSMRELDALQAESSGVLAARIARGSRAAMVVLGARLIEGDRDEEGLDLLRRAADAGSIYAYYELSNAHARSPDLADRIEAAAFLRVAYILGDARAALELQRRFIELGPRDHIRVDARAASLHRTFAKSRRPDPRPMDAD